MILINNSKDAHQPNLFGHDLLKLLEPTDPLLQVSTIIPREDFDHASVKIYK